MLFCFSFGIDWSGRTYAEVSGNDFRSNQLPMPHARAVEKEHNRQRGDETKPR